MHAIPFHRRQFVKGLGAVTGMLPMLQGLRPASAQNTFPKRLLLVFSPNGTVRENWSPTGSATNWQMSRILAPLERHKEHIIVLDGLKNECAHHGPGDGHMTGMGCLWTNTELLPGTLFECGGTDPCSGWGGGISVDQHIADQIQPPTRFRSVELAVQPGGATIWTRMCYRGSDQPVTPIEDPRETFSTLFGDLNVDNASFERLRAQRLSVLDYVSGRVESMSARLGGDDRSKLEAHLDGIREIERRLTIQSPACTRPASPPVDFDFRNNDNYPMGVQLQSDLIARAFACDLTRVASLQWNCSVGGARMTWLGIDRGHHDMSHDGDETVATLESLTQVNIWYSEQFAYLLDKLKEIPEGDGTALDNTVVVWGNELGRGNSHTRQQIPFILAGGGAGYFQTNRFLQYTNNDWHGDLLVSLCQYMGVQTSTFGNPAYCKGPLRLLT